MVRRRGVEAWQTEEQTGGLDDIRFFFSERPSLIAAEADLMVTLIDDVCLRHPAQGSFPLVASCILLVRCVRF